MNLIQIQEHLKDLPTPAIMAYANGQNPQVPPYMALGEMNRRKSMEQRAAQAPNSSVKEKLENELNQQVALPGIGQGMNLRVNPEGMPQPMPAAQPQMAPRMAPMPVQPAARPMPAQQMSQQGSIPAGAPGMAGGGLTELPVRKSMFNYAPGGIVAFADESNEQLVPPAETGEPAVEAPAELDKLPVGLANKILADRLAGKTNMPEPVSRDQVRAEVLAQKPELAPIINKLPGETLTRLASQLEEQNLAQRSKFKEGEGRQGLAALSQALIAAGEATRGQKGMGGIGAAFGGFGKTYNAATAAAEDRANKQQALERAQTIETMKLQSDIEQMQRAFAEGRVDEAMKLKDQIAARQAKIEEIKGTAAKDTLTQYSTQLQREEQKRHNQETERYQKRQADIASERARYERDNRPSKEEKTVLAVMGRLNADPQYKSLLTRQSQFNPADPEFSAIQDALDSIRDAAFADAKLAPPTKRDRLLPAIQPIEPGFFKRLRMTSEDREAIEWANANPRDPRAAQIKQNLGF
jgi:hypothetical protein